MFQPNRNYRPGLATDAELTTDQYDAMRRVREGQYRKKHGGIVYYEQDASTNENPGKLYQIL